MKKFILITLSIFTLFSCTTKVDNIVGGWRVLRTVDNSTGDVVQDGTSKVIFSNDGTYSYTKATQPLPYHYDGSNIYFGDGNTTHPFVYVLNDYSLVIHGYIPSDDVIDTTVDYTTYLYKY